MKITVLPGDGIGIEVTREAVAVLKGVADAFGFTIETEEHLIGGAAIRETGSPLPDATLEACLASDAVCLAPSARRNLMGCRPKSGRRSGCWDCERLWAVSQIFGPQRRYRR